MDEFFLHFVWQYQFFEKVNLRTVQGESIAVLHPGVRNENQGPDFSHAKILMDGIEWHGNVEIHIKTSDWWLHNHQDNALYDSIILHVVWEHNQELERANKSALPVIELKGRVDLLLIDKYRVFINSGIDLPCQFYRKDVPEVILVDMLSKAGLQRLEKKVAEVFRLLEANANDWEETLWQLFVRNFGMNINNDTFFELSKLIPYRVISKIHGSQIQLEALLFGISGLLVGIEGNEYAEMLKREYDFLCHKYSFGTYTLQSFQWKFMRTRPGNFPTIRIAQLAAFLSKGERLVNFTEHLNSGAFKRSTKNMVMSDYWETHVRFSGPSKAKQASSLPDDLIQNLLLNAIIPYRLARLSFIGDDVTRSSCFETLEDLPSERNKITRIFQELNFPLKNAFDSQACLELYKEYCIKRKCLYCSIGCFIVKR